LQRSSQIECCGGFADSPFLIENCNDAHGASLAEIKYMHCETEKRKAQPEPD
jgi:hypothetical protein